MSYKLSEGSLEVIMSGGHVEKPVMQILGSKKLQGGPAEKYRLLISDGKHSHSFAMLASQLNYKLVEGELCDYSVVQIERFITSVLNNGKGEKRVMVILDLTVLEKGDKIGKKLGSPVTWSENAAVPTPQAPKPTPRPVSNPVASSTSTTMSSTNGHDTSLNSTMSQFTHPIASLSPYLKKWVIKARVMSKGSIRTWSNAKSEGKLFSMDLCDESGEIRATAFNNEVDRFYELIKVEKVYFISNCSIKTANKQYSSLKNDYEMSLTSDTMVQECTEDSSDVPTVKYDFTPIAEVANLQANATMDVIGVAKSATDIQEFTARSTGKTLKKREVTLMDASGGAVSVTLWGSEAESFDSSTNPVVAIKGARVTEFNGSKSLGLSGGSAVLRLNPDLPEAHKLRGWFDKGGANMDVVNISAKSGAYSGGSNEWISFAEAETKQLGAGEKGDYYSLLGVLTFISSDNAVYKACPSESCNKKLVDQENGLYRCEKCNRDYPNYKHRLLMWGNVSDATGEQRITAFSDAGEAMLGKSSEEIGTALETDKKAYTDIFDDVKFKTFVFKMRTKMETYSDEARLKTTVMSAAPVDYVDANMRFIKNIKALTGVEV